MFSAPFVPTFEPPTDPASTPPAIPGTLFVVATPIGNLGDITLRAIEVLRGVDAILCEDTRHSRTLLTRHDIRVPTESLHEHNEAAATPRLLSRLAAGARFALVSDAGTPVVSDPGARLVAAAIDAGIPVVPIPGASAVITALTASGLGGGAFTFLGFLERKGAGRREQLALVSGLPHAAVLYEAPNRVGATLAELVESGCGARRGVVARELTKQHEEFRRGTVAELAEYYREVSPRGEVVLIIEGRGAADEAGPNPGEVEHAVAAMRAEGLGARDVAQALRDRFGLPRNEAYRIAHE